MAMVPATGKPKELEEFEEVVEETGNALQEALNACSKVCKMLLRVYGRTRLSEFSPAIGVISNIPTTRGALGGNLQLLGVLDNAVDSSRIIRQCRC